MERLTEKEMNGDYVMLKKCAKSECCSDCGECEVDEEALKKLKDYEDAEEQGLLIRLPCKVGDTVYRINPYAKAPIKTMRVSKVVFAKSYSGYSNIEIYAIDVEDLGQYAFYEREINKIVFLTREEAEAALAEMEK